MLDLFTGLGTFEEDYSILQLAGAQPYFMLKPC